MDETICPRCNKKMVKKPNMFHWRGRFFSGLVCEACKGLWDDPDDSFAEHLGLKPKKTNTV